MLFERDALVYAAARRRSMIDKQYEGLVFGRLDLGDEHSTADEREVRCIGRLGVRDDDYEPLVVDWRAPAASAFYRATPVDPMGVVRRRVLRCKARHRRRRRGRPDGARGARRHRRARRRRADRGPHPQPRPADARHRRDHPAPPGRGHPGALARRHRDHRRPGHRQDGRGAAPGGLPALLRAAPLRERRHPRRRPVGRLHRLHRARAAQPGRGVGGAARDGRPRRGDDRHPPRLPRGGRDQGVAAHPPAASGSPRALRPGRRACSGRSSPATPCGSTTRCCAGCARRCCAATSTTSARMPRAAALAEAAWRSVRQGERDVFLRRLRRLARRRRASWPRGGARSNRAAAALALPTPTHVYAVSRGVSTRRRARAVAWSYREALELGTWSVSDAALVTTCSPARPGAGGRARGRRLLRHRGATERSQWGVSTSARGLRPSGARQQTQWVTTPPTPRATDDGAHRPALGYAHVLVDEAQDLSADAVAGSRATRAAAS